MFYYCYYYRNAGERSKLECLCATLVFCHFHSTNFPLSTPTWRCSGCNNLSWHWPLQSLYGLLVISLFSAQSLISLHSLKTTLDKTRRIIKILGIKPGIIFPWYIRKLILILIRIYINVHLSTPNPLGLHGDILHGISFPLLDFSLQRISTFQVYQSETSTNVWLVFGHRPTWGKEQMHYIPQ